MIRHITTISLMLMALQAYAGHLHPERWYQARWCDGATEVVLHDRTRIDCLTDTHAWEVDFARKWYEAIGQALWYAAHTAKRAGVALIVERDADEPYVRRCANTIAHYGLPIDLTVLRPPPVLPNILEDE